MATNLGRAVLYLTGDSKELEQSLGGLGGKVKEGLSGIGGFAKEAFAFATGGLITEGINAIGGSVGGMLSKMVQGNAEFETYNAQFTTLMGSSSAAKDKLEELATFAAKTPFELPEVIQASKNLLTFGGAALNTSANMNLIGNAAAAVGQPITDVSFWIGRAYSAMKNGQPFGEASMRLMEMGIMSGETRTQLEGLQKAGASGEQVWAAFSKGIVSPTDAMEKLGGTFTGLKSTLSDTWDALLRTVGKPIFDVAKKSMEGLIGVLSSPAIQEGAQALGEGIANGIQTAIDAISQLINAFRVGAEAWGPTGGVSNALRFLGLDNIADIVDAVSEPLDDIIALFMKFTTDLSAGNVGAVLDDIGKAFAEVFGGDIGEQVQGALGSIIDFGNAIQSTVQNVVIPILGSMLDGFRTILPGIIDVVTAAFGGILSIVQELMGQVAAFLTTNGASIRETFTSAFRDIAGIVRQLLADVSNIVQSIFGGIAVFLKAHNAEIQAFMTGAWQQISAIIKMSVELIQLTIVPIFNAIAIFLKLHGQEIQDALGGAWKIISGVIKVALDLIQGILTVALAVMKGDWSGAWEAIKTMAVNVINDIVRVLTGGFEIIKALFDAAGFTKVGQDLIDGLLNGITGAWNGLVTAFNNLVNGLIATVKGWFGVASPSSIFAQIGADLVNGLWNGINSIWNSTVANIGTLVSNLIETIRGLFNLTALAQAGSDLVTGLWNSITRIWATTVGTIGTLANSAIAAVTGVLNITVLVQSGTDFITGLWNGINNTWNTIKTNLNTILNGVTKLVTDVLKADSLVDAGKILIEGLWNGIKWVWDQDIPLLTGLANKMLAAVGSTLTVESLVQTGKNFITGLWNGIKPEWDTVQGNLNTILGGVKGLVDKVLNADSLVDAGKALIEGLWNGIKWVWNQDIPIITDLANKLLAVVNSTLTIESLVQTGRDFITGLWNGITAIWTTTIGDIGTLVTGAITVVTGVLNLTALEQAGQDLISGLWNGITDAWSGFKTDLSNTIGQIIGIVESALGISGNNPAVDFIAIGRSIVDGISKGLTDAWEDLKQLFNDLFDDLMNSIESFLGISSPSTVTYGIGMNMMVGLSNGIEAGGAGLAGVMTGVVSGALNSLSATVGEFTGGTSTDPLAGVLSWIKRLIESLAALSWEIADFSQVAQTDAKELADTIGKVVDGITKALDALTALGGFKMPAMGAVNSALDKVQVFIKDLVARFVTLAGTATEDMQKAASTFATNITPVVGIISGALTALTELGKPLAINPNTLFDSLDRLQVFLFELEARFVQLGTIIAVELQTVARTFAENVGPVVGIVSSALSALTALGDFKLFSSFGPINAALDQLRDFLAALVERFGTLARTTAIELQTAAKTFAENVGPVVGIVQNGIAALAALGDYKVLPSFDPISAALDQLQEFLATLIKRFIILSLILTTELQTEAKTFAENVGPVISTVGEALSALTALNNYALAPSLDSINAALIQLQYFLHSLVARFSDLSGILTDELQAAAKTFADNVGPVISMVQNGIAALTTLNDYRLLPSLEPINEALVQLQYFLHSLVDRFSTIGDLLGVELQTAAKTFAENVGPVVGMVRDGIAALAALNDYKLLPSLEPINAALIQLQYFLHSLVDRFGELSKAITEDLQKAARAFAENVGPVMGTVSGALTALVALNDYRVLPSLEPINTALDQLRDFLHSLVDRFVELSRAITEDLQKAARTFAENAGPVVGTIQAGITALTALNDYKGPLSFSSFTTVLDLLQNFLHDLVDRFGELSRAITGEVQTAAKTFAENVGPVVGTIKNSIDALVALNEYKGPVSFSSFTTVLNLIGSFLSGLETRFNELSNTITTDVQTAVKKFAENLNPVIALVKTSIDTIASVIDKKLNQAAITNMLDAIVAIIKDIVKHFNDVAVSDLGKAMPTIQDFADLCKTLIETFTGITQTLSSIWAIKFPTVNSISLIFEAFAEVFAGIGGLASSSMGEIPTMQLFLNECKALFEQLKEIAQALFDIGSMNAPDVNAFNLIIDALTRVLSSLQGVINTKGLSLKIPIEIEQPDDATVTAAGTSIADRWKAIWDKIFGGITPGVGGGNFKQFNISISIAPGGVTVNGQDDAGLGRKIADAITKAIKDVAEHEFPVPGPVIS